ncbi:xanthine dehydrogenase family protein subunit M [Beijerinckia sp. L45]|uniref:FAD binding domain-containing protein n=1 Tax=Beijerinckia sp. L45 TaxID=1641855 RepID=UPI00131CEB29|nr:FAD binding domain-containing protein [Beijerinckia sp. L45]
MKARDIQYERARSLQDAVDLLHRHGPDARLIAGGQSLVPALNLRLAAPEMLVDIGALAELRGIRLVEVDGVERLRIGALTRHVDIERSALIAAHVPLLALAVKHVAHAAIRNRGTFGGSIAHADPASEFPACVLALGAMLHIAGRDGTRTVAAADFFLGLHETAIKAGEILVAVDIDPLGEGFRSGFAELARRSGDYALVGVALQGRPLPGRTLFAVVAPAFFSVGDRPLLADAAAAILMDAAVADGDRIRLAQESLAADLDPPTDPQMSGAARLHLARVLLGRVVAEVLAASQGVARG